MNQLTLFDTPAPTKRSLSYDETLAVIRRVETRTTQAIGVMMSAGRRNWLHHTPDMEYFAADLPANVQFDPQTFAQARQTLLTELGRNAAEETISAALWEGAA